MSKRSKPLTDLQIKALKPPVAREEMSFGGGLYLVVSPTGAKSWAMRYRRFGKPQKLTLGRYVSAGSMLPETAAAEPKAGGALSISGARLLAERARRALEQDVDPARLLKGEAPRARPRDVEGAFAEFARLHVTAHNRASSAKEANRLFATKVKPAWKGRSLDSIKRRDVIDLVGEVRDEGAPVSANRVLALVRKFFNWCVEQEYLEVSPCTSIRRPTAEVSRDRFLSDAEIATLWRASEFLHPPFRQFVRLLVLTGQRRSEVAAMRWSEISPDGRLWSLPKARTKNGRAHIVPLSFAARTELESIPRLAGAPDYVFTTGMRGKRETLTPISGFSKLKAQLDGLIVKQPRSEQDASVEDRDAAPPAWRIHDLRRTVATGMQRLGVELRVVEKVINHISGSSAGIVAVYQVHEYEQERREALDRWSEHVLALAQGSTA